MVKFGDCTQIPKYQVTLFALDSIYQFWLRYKPTGTLPWLAISSHSCTSLGAEKARIFRLTTCPPTHHGYWMNILICKGFGIAHGCLDIDFCTKARGRDERKPHYWACLNHEGEKVLIRGCSAVSFWESIVNFTWTNVKLNVQQWFNLTNLS